MPPPDSRSSIPPETLDAILAAQFMVAWAGETGEDGAPRLGWWPTDLAWEDGNDILADLFPNTHPWAMFQALCEAAQRRDATLRGRAAEADRLLTLFHLGVDTDEQLAERLQHLKRAGDSPFEALPDLAATRDGWNRESFLEWVEAHGEARYSAGPTGRQLQGVAYSPTAPQALVRHLLAALSPLAEDYPLPHLRITP